MDLRRLIERANIEWFKKRIHSLKGERFIVSNNLKETEWNKEALAFLKAFDEAVAEFLEELSADRTKIRSAQRALQFIKPAYGLIKEELFLYYWSRSNEKRTELLLELLEAKPSEWQEVALNKLEECASAVDYRGMRFIKKHLLDWKDEQVQDTFFDAYMRAIDHDRYDVFCSKMGEDPVGFIREVLSEIDYLESLFPEENFSEERWQLFKRLAQEHSDIKLKTEAIEKALKQFDVWVEEEKALNEFYVYKAETLLDRMKIVQDFSFNAYEEVLQTLAESFESMSESFKVGEFYEIKYSVYECNVPQLDEVNQLIEAYEKRFYQRFVSAEIFMILDWVGEMRKVLDHKDSQPDRRIPYLVIQQEYAFMEEQMKKLLDYEPKETHRQRALANSLHVLSAGVVAFRPKVNYLLRSLHFYQILVNKHPEEPYVAHDQAEVIEKLVQLYAHHDSLYQEIDDWLEKGFEGFRIAFPFLGENLSYRLHVAEFLEFAYKWTVKMDKNKLLQERKPHYLKALELGEKHYTQPYYGLAKIALIEDDLETCKEHLRTCDEIFSNEYHAHDFKDCLKDGDFEPVCAFIHELVDERMKTVKEPPTL